MTPLPVSPSTSISSPISSQHIIGLGQRPHQIGHFYICCRITLSFAIYVDLLPFFHLGSGHRRLSRDFPGAVRLQAGSQLPARPLRSSPPSSCRQNPGVSTRSAIGSVGSTPPYFRHFSKLHLAGAPPRRCRRSPEPVPDDKQHHICGIICRSKAHKGRRYSSPGR